MFETKNLGKKDSSDSQLNNCVLSVRIRLNSIHYLNYVVNTHDLHQHNGKYVFAQFSIEILEIILWSVLPFSKVSIFYFLTFLGRLIAMHKSCPPNLIFFFSFWPCLQHIGWMFLGQGSNLQHSNLSHCSDNARSLTC